MKRLLIILIWLPTTLATIVITLALQNFRHHFAQNERLASLETLMSPWQTTSYQLYSSLPRVLGASTVAIKGEDALPDLVSQYLTKNDSPMAPFAQDFVATARKYDLDPLLMLAIAQCESNLGKKMPAPDCYNPFGWGIHSKGTLCFASWQAGFEAVAKGLRDKYFNKGLNSPEELMVRYTPPALDKDGSWAKCVNFFLSQFAASE